MAEHRGPLYVPRHRGAMTVLQREEREQLEAAWARWLHAHNIRQPGEAHAGAFILAYDSGEFR